MYPGLRSAFCSVSLKIGVFFLLNIVPVFGRKTTGSEKLYMWKYSHSSPSNTSGNKERSMCYSKTEHHMGFKFGQRCLHSTQKVKKK